MKAKLSVTLIGCAILFVGCETTSVSGGNQEAKRRAALEQRKQEPQPDQATSNLWYAHDNMLNRDSNPNRAY